MCGIIGYIGKQDALPVIMEGLKNMEYRGYDSSGFAVLGSSGVSVEKAVGKLAILEEKINGKKFAGHIALGHNRWATHGGVTEANAHPHADCKKNIFLAHNGIIENHKELKSELKKNGHEFRSETDTEAIAHLIEEENKKHPFEEAVRLALNKISGTYGLVIFSAQEPDTLIAARNFSPLLLGVGDGEYFIASDASAVLKHTGNVIYLDDGEIAVLKTDKRHIYDLGRNSREKELKKIEWSPESAKKEGYPHFMLKEIFEGPDAVRNSIRGRILSEEGLARLGGLSEVMPQLKKAKRVLVSGCGTAYFAGKVGEYMLEEYAGIPVKTDLASEFRYKKPVFQDGDIFLAISQSGETADTLGALREAKEKGVPTLGIVNVVGSTLARETDAGAYQHIGPEIGVASTKAFVSQVAILALFSVLLGRQREMSLVTGQRILRELRRTPDLMAIILKQKDSIKAIAEKYKNFGHFLYLGRKYNFPVALEGALKLKEISYAHAEGCGAGEMKHGPIAMIDENFPVVALAPRDSVYEKMISNLEEIKARDGPVVAVATEGDEEIKEITPDVIYIPKTLEMLTPILSVVPLQLFAYYLGVSRGRDVDKPRNLAKSVTVE